VCNKLIAIRATSTIRIPDVDNQALQSCRTGFLRKGIKRKGTSSQEAKKHLTEALLCTTSKDYRPNHVSTKHHQEFLIPNTSNLLFYIQAYDYASRKYASSNSGNRADRLNILENNTFGQINHEIRRRNSMVQFDHGTSLFGF